MMRLPLSMFYAASIVVVVCSCTGENQDSRGVQEAILRAEVDGLQEKLTSLTGSIDEEIQRIRDDQKTLVSEASVQLIDLQSQNLTAVVERFQLPETLFAGLIGEMGASGLYSSIQTHVSDGKAVAHPTLIAVISTISADGEPPTFVIADQRDLEVPTQFSKAEKSEENPALAPVAWSREELGVRFSGKILAKENNRLLIGTDFRELTRMANELYPFPRVFKTEEPGSLEMPVIHEAKIETTIVAEIGKPEFLGTLAISSEKANGERDLQVVFLTLKN